MSEAEEIKSTIEEAEELLPESPRLSPFMNLHQVVQEAAIAAAEKPTTSSKVASTKLPGEVYDLLERQLRDNGTNVNAFLKQCVYIYLSEHLTPTPEERGIVVA